MTKMLPLIQELRSGGTFQQAVTKFGKIKTLGKGKKAQTSLFACLSQISDSTVCR